MRLAGIGTTTTGGHEIAKAQLSGAVVPLFQAHLEGERHTP